MYRVDRSSNRIARLQEVTFSDLGFRERAHLQEWLANLPEALGEDLLVIQKEFDGFADTKERLDLLAVDKQGNLVVIENKLDDSGRDVTWQAIKYAAYVSTLKKAEIVQIYQHYLDRNGGGNAVTNLCEFLDVDDLEEAELNSGSGQRLVFIAAHFRREVTASVLWLIARNIRAQCFKVTPHLVGEELVIDVRQIIPVPEAADYMIGVATKETEQSASQHTRKKRHLMRLSFWERALARLRADGVGLFSNVNPTRDHWLSTGTGIGGCHYTMIFSRDEVRVELGVQRADGLENKRIFDRLHADRDEIEKRFGAALEWRRMDDNKASRIVYRQEIDGFDEANWDDMAAWLSRQVAALERAFSSAMVDARQALAARDADMSPPLP